MSQSTDYCSKQILGAKRSDLYSSKIATPNESTNTVLAKHTNHVLVVRDIAVGQTAM